MFGRANQFVSKGSTTQSPQHPICISYKILEAEPSCPGCFRILLLIGLAHGVGNEMSVPLLPRINAADLLQGIQLTTQRHMVGNLVHATGLVFQLGRHALQLFVDDAWELQAISHPGLREKRRNSGDYVIYV